MRTEAFDAVVARHGHVVAYGPFKGMHLPEEPAWGFYDLTPKILGTYEEKIQNKIEELLDSHRIPFIDVGAADGYFAIGVSRLKETQRTIAYESCPRTRASLLEQARRNGVT